MEVEGQKGEVTTYYCLVVPDDVVATVVYCCNNLFVPKVIQVTLEYLAHAEFWGKNIITCLGESITEPSRH